MSIKKNTVLGNIKISDEAVATLVGGAVIECYGVVGMASQKFFKDGFSELLKRENYSKGVIIKNTPEGIKVDLYVVIGYGVRVTEVISEIQKRVKYTLEKALDLDVNGVNVYVQGIKVIG